MRSTTTTVGPRELKEVYATLFFPIGGDDSGQSKRLVKGEMRQIPCQQYPLLRMLIET